MNIRLILYIIGQILRAEGILMIIPLITSICYRENVWPLAIPMAVLLVLGVLLTFKKPADRDRMRASIFKHMLVCLLNE